MHTQISDVCDPTKTKYKTVQLLFCINSLRTNLSNLDKYFDARIHIINIDCD